MSEHTLSISMRPKVLEEVIGHLDVVNAIKKQISSGRIPKGWLFVGPPGVGKTTLAHIVARMVQGPDFPHGEVEPDVEEVNAADHGKVADARRFAQDAEFNPRVGKYRIVIMDEMQQATPEAQNVFLKLLEDPQSKTLFIFCTTDPGKLIQALKDRCLKFRLGTLNDLEVGQLVDRAYTKLGLPAKTATVFCETLFAKDVRSPRDILMSLERFAGGMEVKKAVQTEDDKPEYADIAKAVVKGDWKVAREILKTMRSADVRGLRSVVARFLGIALLDADTKKQADPFAVALIYFEHVPFEDGVAFDVTKRAIYCACQTIKEAK